MAPNPRACLRIKIMNAEGPGDPGTVWLSGLVAEITPGLSCRENAREKLPLASPSSGSSPHHSGPTQNRSWEPGSCSWWPVCTCRPGTQGKPTVSVGSGSTLDCEAGLHL